jgi:diguanylate cyclase (GGDEF)-like protein
MTAPAPHRRSLGFAIKVVVFGLIGATAVVFATGLEVLRLVNAHYAQVTSRIQDFERDASGLLTAMLNQEVGLRAYLATGETPFLEPLDLGERQEQARQLALRDGAEAIGDPALSPALDRVLAAIEHWHREIAKPQIRDRGEGSIADVAHKMQAGKLVFDALRAEHAHLIAAVEATAAAQQAARASLVAWIVIGMVAVAVAVWALAAVVTLRVVRRITRPLLDLVQRADQLEGFAAPPAGESIHEVFALATALHRLDAQVRGREAELAHAHDDALALTRFGEFVQQLQHEDELHKGLARVCKALVAPSQVNILVRNASKNRLSIAHATVAHEPRLRLPILAEPMKCRAVRTMRNVRANSDDPTACECALGVPARGSMLCVPMLAAGELVGVLNLHSARGDDFDEPRIHALHGYIGFASGALSSLQLLAATRERALRDSLTGAHNRAFLSEYLPKTIAAAKRHRTQVAVLMADLDHFKRINDEYGHPIGDQAIVAFARCVQQQIRATDVLVRYGGEEFAIVLADVTRDGAIGTAERIRGAVEAVRLSANGIDLGAIVRVSIGIAMFPDHGEELPRLVSVADAALYTAKQQGRNQVVVADANDAGPAVALGAGDRPLRPDPAHEPS